MRVLGYKLTCCIINAITMTIEVDTSTTLYGDELCVVINLDTVASWEIETGKQKLQTGFGQFLPVYFRNLLAGIWGSFLRFIITGFRNWLAAYREPALTQKVSLRLKPY